MDHWGDPWADDADTNTNITTPAKVAHSPRPPTTPAFQPAPIVLNSFLDDAVWGSNEWATTPSPRKDEDRSVHIDGNGSEHASGWDAGSTQEENGTIKGDHYEEGSSAWVASPRIQTPTDVDVNGQEHTSGWEIPSVYDEEEQRENQAIEAGNEWSRIEEEVEGSKGVGNEISETSDSATTIQADNAPARESKDITASLHREDDTSTRSSVSHSEGSHHEAATESPRTSIEEERATGKLAEATHQEEEFKDTEPPKEHQESDEQEVDDEFGDFEDDVAQGAAETQLDTASTHGQPESTSKKNEDDTASNVHDAHPAVPTSICSGPVDSFVLDSKLLAELFPPAKNAPKLGEPPDDPIASTSTRKAWYRLTRKQTMREYNSGAVDDTYIRVTWRASHIRSEANKTVARWANEDRIAGRGPGARASFFWDSSAPPDKKAHEALHARQKSSVSSSKPARPASQIVPPLSTEVPVAFNWSSPSSASHAVPDNFGMRATSSPITAKHSAITKLQRPSGRAASLDLSPRPKELASHKRTSTATDLQNGIPPPVNPSTMTPIQAPPSETFDPWASATTSSPVPPVPPTTYEHFDPWSGLGTLDTSSPTKQDNSTVEDDDEWGEMVESPALSTSQTPVSAVHTPLGGFSEPTTQNNTISTTAATLLSARSSPVQPLPPPTGPVHASPIVRLKGTVSPTSALFKPNALVPTDSEERVGPHLLRKTNRSREATPEKAQAAPVQMPTMDEVLGQEPAKEDVAQRNDSEPSATTTPISTTPSDPVIPPGTQPTAQDPAFISTPPPPPPPADQPNWGDDADFSIFESALLSANPTLPTPAAQSDPSDPWSLFSSLPTEASAPFVRPAARPITTPTKQPLTGATSSAQRRKAEEDDIVRGIVDGLPDLRYMLRR